MSDNDEDLFADSDDTADLIQQSKATPPEKKKKTATKRLKRKGSSSKSGSSKKKAKKIPDADANDSDDDNDKGIFDDSDDDDDDKPAMTKRERMEALRKKKMGDSKPDRSKREKESNVSRIDKAGADDDDAESVDSANFQLNEDDRNFIDTEGDDADAINELYAEQHFDDVEAEEDNEDYDRKKKKGRGGGGGYRQRRDNPDRLDPEADKDNPIMQAVNRMKKKKKVQKSFTELEEEAKEFIFTMEAAADEDDEAIKEGRPAFKKLAMLNSVLDMMTRRDMTRQLLDCELLKVCRRWIQPLPSGKLGNVTIRQRLCEAIANMTGEMGITPSDLKRSEFGKTIMTLYMHKSETPAMKRQLKSLIEQWSRPIFQKSGNMRDLQHAANRGGGLARLSRQYQEDQQMHEAVRKPKAVGSSSRAGKSADLQTLIVSGVEKGKKDGIKRVRVPYSKGFQYTVRPMGRVSDMNEKPKNEAMSRGNLSRRMMEKGRAVSKNQRSANVSVEGRKVK